MTTPSHTIKLGHARDHLRQHFAIDAGLESMDNRPLGSAFKDVDAELREECTKKMQQCRDNAHWEISGLIHGTKIAVWKERPDGGLEPAGAEWAKGIFDAKGIMPAALYFDKAEWEALLVSMTTAESRAYFAEVERDDPLALWLALEIRRADAAFRKSRKEQDADFEAKRMRKTGVRVKLTLKSASEICVALADATIGKAAEFASSPAALSSARAKVAAFTRNVAMTSVSLAHFVGGGSPSVVTAATSGAKSLEADIAGAFILAESASVAAISTVAERVVVKRQRGRKSGSGSMAQADAPHLAKMKCLIANNEAFSPEGAAKLVWRDAVGNGTENSKITRLAKRYRAAE